MKKSDPRLFNPFANDFLIKKDSLQNVSVREETYIRLVKQTEQKLAELPPGKRVVTYHGFGGTMPPNMAQESAEVVGPGVLQLWRTI